MLVKVPNASDPVENGRQFTPQRQVLTQYIVQLSYLARSNNAADRGGRPKTEKQRRKRPPGRPEGVSSVLICSCRTSCLRTLSSQVRVIKFNTRHFVCNVQPIIGCTRQSNRLIDFADERCLGTKKKRCSRKPAVCCIHCEAPTHFTPGACPVIPAQSSLTRMP